MSQVEISTTEYVEVAVQYYDVRLDDDLFVSFFMRITVYLCLNFFPRMNEDDDSKGK